MQTTSIQVKILSLFIGLCITNFGFAQNLPIDFEAGISTSNFVDFDGGVASVIPNPQSTGLNTSATVAQIVRDGGAIWAGSKMTLASPLDFSSMNTISMKVFTAAPAGTVVKFKLEGNGDTERDAITTVSNAWETLTWDFTGAPAGFTDLVFMFDFGNVGDGSANSTFLFDDVEQLFGGFQLDLPVDFENPDVNYTVTDFGGNASSMVADPTDPSNTVIKSIKTTAAATWAGTTIGTPSGFATNIPLTLTDSKMTVRVWSPDAGTPIRLKVEDSNDPTHTCETETNTTLAGAWETIEFDFANEAPGTAALSFGLMNGWSYNMASIFFNFDTDGITAGEKTYYFDDVRFGDMVLNVQDNAVQQGLSAFPNPSAAYWTVSAADSDIQMIELFDVQGKRIQTLMPNASSTEINAAHLSNGVYMARITTEEGIGFIRLVRE